jgi:carbon-monoxide dehydrogenase medium subunit
MKPAPFEYVDPRTVDETLQHLRRYGDDGKVLAGGQSLMPMLNLRLARPRAVIDVNRVTELDGSSDDGAELRLGALARQHAVERSARTRLPLLAAALKLVGHDAIRHRGTIAGSIAHADPAAELPAVLLALDGSVVARSTRGERVIAARDFFQGPLATALAADELVTETRWPVPAPGTGWGFHEVARRHGDFALVGAVALVRLAGGIVERTAIAVFAAGPTPVRAAATERALVGQSPAPARLTEAAQTVAGAIDPADDLHASARYRRRVAVTLVARALTDAVARATGHGGPR